MNTPQLDVYLNGCYDWIANRRRSIQVLAAMVLTVSVVAVYILVYRTGGIKYVYSHSMYVPILLSGFIFGIRGGVLMATIGGLALGPLMPLVVATGEQQTTINWLYRAGFFILIGMLMVLLAQ